MTKVYLFEITADGGGGHWIGHTSIHATKDGALAALERFFYEHELWFDEFGVDWGKVWAGASDTDRFVGNDVPMLTDDEGADGLSWGINAMEVGD